MGGTAQYSYEYQPKDLIIYMRHNSLNISFHLLQVKSQFKSCYTSLYK